MKKHSLCFTIVALFLGSFIGTVMGSLLETIFGLPFLNQYLLPGEGFRIQNFYNIRELTLQVTPATVAGLAVTAYFLYRTTTLS